MVKKSTAIATAGSAAGRLALAILATFSMLVGFPEKSWASSACDAFNQPQADGFYTLGGIPALSPLSAGDVITVTASHPVGPSATNFVPSTVFLRFTGSNSPIGGTMTTPFPGTITFTVPSGFTTGGVEWQTNPENPINRMVEVTWAISCQNAPLANPTLSTQASAGSLLGAAVSDTATLSGGNNPTGATTFNLYGPDDATCAAPPVFTSTVNVAGNGAYTSSPSFTPASPGTYRWTAAYSGDAGNTAASSPCNAPNESVAIRPFQPPAPTSTLTGDLVGPVTVGAAQSVLINGARLVGPVTVEPGGALTIVNSRVTRGITANAPSFLSICGTDVSGPAPATALSVTNAPVPIRVGDAATGCAGNRFAGQVVLTGNAGVTFGSNAVSHNATVDGNGPGTSVIKANTVFGTLGCAGNNPAPTNAGQVNTSGAKTGQCTVL